MTVSGCVVADSKDLAGSRSRQERNHGFSVDTSLALRIARETRARHVEEALEN
jgi:hypothetical protein